MKTVIGRMSRDFSLPAWCLCVLLIACTVGCQKETPPAPDANEPGAAKVAEPQAPAELPAPAPEVPPLATPEAAPAPDPNLAVVTINGEAITEGQLGAAVDNQMRRAGAQFRGMPPGIVEQVKNQMRQRVLDMLVSERLLDQQIEAADVVVTDEEILASIAAQGARRNPPMTVDQFKAAVEAQGGTFEEAKEQYRKGLARQKFMESQWAGKIDVNEADAQAYYDATPAEFKNEEKVRASHVLIKPATPEPGADPNITKVAARAKTEKLLQEIKDGADFAEVAKANSDCPSASKGGDLGFFPRKQMVPPFDKAAFAMQPGEMSGIVETKFGYHIIKVTDRQEAGVTPFEEAKAGIIEKLTMQKKSEIAQTFLETLKEKATIVYAEGSGLAAAPAVRPAPVQVAAPPAPADANAN